VGGEVGAYPDLKKLGIEYLCIHTYNDTYVDDRDEFLRRGRDIERLSRVGKWSRLGWCVDGG
jgi:hypothetical protein